MQDNSFKLPRFASRLLLLEILLGLMLFGWYAMHVFIINKETIKDEFQEIADIVDDSIIDEFNNVYSILLYISATLKESEEFNPNLVASALQIANKQKAHRPFFSWDYISWSDVDFVIKIHSAYGKLKAPYADISNLDYLPKTIVSPDKLQVGAPIIEPISKKTVLPVGLGLIAGKKQDYAGTLHSGFDIDQFVANIYEHLEKNQKVSFLLFDKNGVTIAESKDHFLSQNYPHMVKEYLDIFDGQKYFKFTPFNLLSPSKSFYINMLGESRYYLYIVMHEQTIRNKMIASIQRTFYDLSLMITLSIVIFLFVRRFVVMPVISLSQISQKIANNELDNLTIEEYDTVETALLADSLRQEVTQKIKLQDTNNRMKYLINNLEIVDQIKHDFIRNIQHELRTPLNHIIGGCTLLSSGFINTENAPLLDYVYMISKSGQELLEKINNILLITDLESSEIRISDTICSVQVLIEDALNPLLSLIQQNKLQLHVTVAPDIPKVKLDREKVQIALFNIFNNSIKFNIHGGNIWIKVSHTVGGILISVRNTGEIIPQDQLNNITKIFNVGDSMLRKIKSGLGLGLAITQHILKLHEIKMQIANESPNIVEINILIPNIRTVELVK